MPRPVSSETQLRDAEMRRRRTLIVRAEEIVALLRAHLTSPLSDDMDELDGLLAQFTQLKDRLPE